MKVKTNFLVDSDIEQDVEVSGSKLSSSSDELETDMTYARQCMLNEDTPPPPMFPFVAKPKIHFQKEDDTTILDYFNLFLSDEIRDMTTLETNSYALQSLDGRPSFSSSTWTDVTSAEIRVFLALIVLQSVVKKPAMKQYWSQDVHHFFLSGENPLLYLNRKGYSLNVQMVRDAKRKIRNIVARCRGSTHNSRIWNDSSLKRKYETVRRTMNIDTTKAAIVAIAIMQNIMIDSEKDIGGKIAPRSNLIQATDAFSLLPPR
ncbi:Transposase IS4 [Popillia japonica]|uniref:Transposase IS4 n=1 Tax=Popillia japonica TaxID=7064 RepID=A0AAW1LJ74_POPJA